MPGQAGEAGDPASGRMSATVYDSILELIAAGAVAPNRRLPSETELARRFAASRPVVREALMRLRDDGVIVSRKGSGSYLRRQPDVTPFGLSPLTTLADMQRCFEFRASIEGAAAELAADRWVDADLREIEAALDELAACCVNGSFGVEPDRRLHVAIAAAAHNPYHVAIVSAVMPHIAVGISLLRSVPMMRCPDRLALVHDEHAAIAAAIRDRDARRARQAMEAHLANSRERIFRWE
jgi:DNA-binding FadR family transcriptional regulator